MSLHEQVLLLISIDLVIDAVLLACLIWAVICILRNQRLIMKITRTLMEISAKASSIDKIDGDEMHLSGLSFEELTHIVANLWKEKKL